MTAEAQKEFIPGSYSLNKVVLKNYSGETIDISPLIGKIEVMESIYSMFCIFEFTIVDGVALLEKYGITGNEKIELEISKRDAPGGSDETLTKKLVMTGIKEYARPLNESQAYVLQAVSETALRASAERVTKSVNGDIATIISDLYSEIEYELPLELVDSGTQGNYKIILPNYTYTDTFAFLLAKAQNSQGSTFHLFENLWGDMSFTAYTEIIGRSSIDEYNLTAGTSEDAKRAAAFDEERKKIKNIESFLGLSHYELFKKGGISGRVFSNDIATKTFAYEDFKLLDEDLNKIDKEYIVDAAYEVGGKAVGDFEKSKTYMVNKNTLAFDNSDNFQNKVDESIAKKRFMYENQFAISHNVKLSGDTRLRAGNVIDLKFPTPTDPKFIDDNRDEYFSGKYFIANVRHEFSLGGSYTLTATVRKDSVDRNKMTSKYKNL